MRQCYYPKYKCGIIWDNKVWRRMSRPLLLSQDMIKRIATAVRMGANKEMAMMYGGASFDAYNKWIKLARDLRKEMPDRELNERETLSLELLDTVEKAEAEAVVGWLAKIEQAANAGTWQAAAWKLERRYPRVYGRSVQEVVGPDDGPVQVRFYIPDNGRDAKLIGEPERLIDTSD